MSSINQQIERATLEKIVYDLYTPVSAKTYFRHFKKVYQSMHPDDECFDLRKMILEDMAEYIYSENWKQTKPNRMGMSYKRSSLASHKNACERVIAAKGKY